MSQLGEPAREWDAHLKAAILLCWAAFVFLLNFSTWAPLADFLRSLPAPGEAFAGFLDYLFKPNDPGAGIGYALGHHISHLGKVAVLHLALAGTGFGALRWIVPGGFCGWLAAWGAGFGALSLLILGLGLAGLLFPVPVLLAGFVPAAGGLILLRRNSWTDTLRAAKEAGTGLLKGSRFAESGKSLGMLAFLGVAVLAALAIAPDTSWDAVVYHLRVPAFFIQEHRIFHMPSHHFTAFPLACEMNYCWLMLWGGLPITGGGEGPKLFHLSCALMAGLGAGGLARRMAGNFAGTLAFLFVVLSPFTGTIAVRAYNDFVQAAFAGILLLLFWDRPRGFLRVAGLLGGIAFCAKYTAVIFLAPLALLWARRRPAPYLFAIPAALPWLIKNWLLTGNPVAPFLSGTFGSGPETSFQFAAYVRSVAGMSLNPATLGNAALGVLRGHSGEFFLELVPILAAGLFFLPGQGRGTRSLTLFSALFAGIWLVLAPAVRFFTPVLVPLAALAAVAYRRAESQCGSRWLRPLLGVFLLAGLMRLPVVHAQLFDPIPFAFGRETVWSDVTRSLYPSPLFGPVAKWVNEKLPFRARLLLMIDIKSHYVWRRAYHDFQYAHPGLFLRWLRRGGSLRGLMAKLKQEGVTHILVVRQKARDVGKHYSWQGEELAQAAEFLASRTRRVVGNDKVELLEIIPGGAPRRDISNCFWMLFMHPENLILAGNDAAAAALLERTLSRAPWLHGAYSYLGLAYARLGRYAEAERALLEGLRAGGDRAAQVAHVLGQVRMIKDDRKGAEEAWRKAISLDPAFAEAHFAIGLLMLEEGKLREAREHVTAAARLDPGNRHYAGLLARLENEGE